MTIQIRVEHLSKTFVLHQQHGTQLPVLHDANMTVSSGECVVLHGHSGSGKSTLLRSLYANYLPDSGHIWVNHQGEWLDMVQAEARQILAVRRHTLGWVSQFLRVIPRISALDVVMQPLLEQGCQPRRMPRTRRDAAQSAQCAATPVAVGAVDLLWR
ncbi:Lipoprotein-releasing system ATP-binding protein LolD [Serratia quinivorans]|uniref:Lipoprotein-releasing system ATP-binding protein LolD n=1 Tax=Serratia quinivorans TaxID=137545 RepID=A0A379Z9E8_9GAMM|nr:Lipoprotein-releasing system ATP-binding protein LolD [Serratia quinivorans]